jgi:hypothetical protein
MNSLIYLEQFLKVTSRKSKSIVLVGDLNHDLHSENGTNLKLLDGFSKFYMFSELS